MARLRHVSEIFRDAQAYIFQRADVLERNRNLDAVKKSLKGWLTEHGVPDDDGNLIYDFPAEVGSLNEDKKYGGVMLRKSVGPAYFDEDEVRDFCRSKQPRLDGRVFTMVEVLDEEELYVLQQEGAITEEELRGLIHYPKPTYALWPVESSTVLEPDD